jgi:Uma2 family endonuclease
MATAPRPRVVREIDYPTSGGRPMAETDLHRRIMVELIEVLQAHFAADPRVYVSSDLLIFYEEGNRRKHVNPDVFVVFGVENRLRDNYLVWREGKGPDVVIEVISRTTRREDQTKKQVLYRDVLRVPEYFQFDPTEDYLKPSLQGHRLVGGAYVPIAPVDGRLPSQVLGLHLMRDGSWLRVIDPANGRRLLTSREMAEQAEAARRQAEAENERLRRELEALRRQIEENS